MSCHALDLDSDKKKIISLFNFNYSAINIANYLSQLKNINIIDYTIQCYLQEWEVFK